METPPNFSARIAESRAKHIAPAIGAVWVGRDGTLPIAMHGALPSTGTPHWHIGSCTKAMTASIIGRLVDQGRIRFETTLAEALPELINRMAPAFRDTPLSAVLTHSAGIIRDPADSTFRALRRSTASASAQRLFLAGEALQSPPQTNRGYSNLGYIITGAIIEKITGRTWEAALSREVMIPLGIARFGFGVPGPSHPVGHHRLDDTWQQNRNDNPAAYGPAGRVNLALEEWGRFLRAHVRQTSFLSDATRRQLHHPANNGFAMGWLSTIRNGERMLVHTGSNTAWFAQATLLPDSGIGLGIVCNAYDEKVERAVGDLSMDLIGLVSGGSA